MLRKIIISVCIVISIAIGLSVFYEYQYGIVMEYYCFETTSGADIKFTLRKNRETQMDFGFRNRGGFHNNDFFGEIYNTKKVIISEEDYQVILYGAEMYKKEDLKFTSEMYKETNDGIIDLLVYKNNIYVADLMFYDREKDNFGDLSDAATAMHITFMNNFFQGNPILRY